MSKILLTGASGFIGHHIADELLPQTGKLYALSRVKRDSGTINWMIGDLHNHGQVQNVLQRVKPSILVHCGWNVSHGQYLNSESNVKDLFATQNLYHHFLQNGGEYAVILGSCAELEQQEQYYHTPYGCAKRIASESVSLMASFYTTSFLWLRIFGIFGPGEHQQRFIPMVLHELNDGRQPLLHNPDAILEYSYAKNVAKMVAHAIGHRLTGCVDMQSSAKYTIRELVNYIQNVIYNRQPPSQLELSQFESVLLPEGFSASCLNNALYSFKESIKDYRLHLKSTPA
jgi:nucleoside-diphosphate-sugar epimerase